MAEPPEAAGRLARLLIMDVAVLGTVPLTLAVGLLAVVVVEVVELVLEDGTLSVSLLFSSVM